jgi:hypothetical protein
MQLVFEAVVYTNYYSQFQNPQLIILSAQTLYLFSQRQKQQQSVTTQQFTTLILCFACQHRSF